jgi:hypothetical protein
MTVPVSAVRATVCRLLERIEQVLVETSARPTAYAKIAPAGHTALNTFTRPASVRSPNDAASFDSVTGWRVPSSVLAQANQQPAMALKLLAA